MRQIFKLKRVDTFKSGDHLYVVEEDDSISSFDDIRDVEFDVTQKYVVYHLELNGNLIPLKEFNDYEDAEYYCKKQYTLLNNTYPFITNGYTSSYMATGERLPILTTIEDKLDIRRTTLFDPDYIIIVSEDIFEAHSLNSTSEW